MTHFQFIVLICGGAGTIIACVAIITGAIVKKNSGEIKAACTNQFASMKNDIKESDVGARERNNRILTLEVKFSEIISRLTRLEGIMDKNTEMTSMVYAYMQKRKTNGDKLIGGTMKNIDTWTWITIAIALIALGGIVWKFGVAGIAMLAIFDAALFVALKRLKVLR
jgi:hypothetical protein